MSLSPESYWPPPVPKWSCNKWLIVIIARLHGKLFESMSNYK